MLRMTMKRRLVIYIQATLLFLGGVYLLIYYDRPSPGSWHIPYHAVDPWLINPDVKTKPHATSSVHSATQIPTAAAEAHNDEKGQQDKVIETEVSENKVDDDRDGDAGTKEKEMLSSEPDTVSSPPSGASDSPAATSTPKLTKEHLLAKARSLIPSILDPADTSVDRMTCPPINATRYAHLKPRGGAGQHEYFFALNLRKCVDLLPRLLGSVVEAIAFLGAQHCAVSIVEGNSGDGTLEVLELLRPELDRLGVAYYLRSSALDPSDGLRIKKLALLRAMAVEPITGTHIPDALPDAADDDSRAAAAPLPLSPTATVLFLNDVAACAEDILELAHQRVRQAAHVACAMDWTHANSNDDPTFYDVWVARALNGDLFFDIPAATGGWEQAGHLFPTEPVARSRLAAGRPFQAFSCWNGAAALEASPLVRREVAFRAPRAGECFQGEPQLFCKDMWAAGYGRIAVVPSVNLEYTDALGRRTKVQKGFVSDWVAREEDEVVAAEVSMMIPWQAEPPELVKCMPTFSMQSWLPWNESLV